MASKAFNRFGLRRDRNLSDLPSPTTALNNLLRTPSMLGAKSSFTTVDLEPIRQIYTTNITTSTFASLNGVTVQFTIVANGEIQNNSNPIVYKPIIKIKNRLDSAYFSTGEPFFLGGDGPKATYYDSDQIIREPQSFVANQLYSYSEVVLSNGNLYSMDANNFGTSTAPSHASGIVNNWLFIRNYDEKLLYLNRIYDPLTEEDVTYTDNFWERGRFIYGNKVQNNFLSLFGGVSWQGYYKPTENGIHSFRMNTSGLSEFSFQSKTSPSYVRAFYGNPGNAPYPIAEMNTEGEDSQFVLIQLDTAVNLKTGDFVYLQIDEGPVKSRQYKVFASNTIGTVTSFYINVTRDMNILQQNTITFPTANVAINSGYRCVVRYIPWQNRSTTKYLNSIYHRRTIQSGAYTTSGNNIIISDEWLYKNFMITDYIYDYRIYSGDSTRLARRYKVIGLNDTTKTVTVELDTTYTITPGNNNDQVAYYSGNVIVFDSSFGYTQITQVGATGQIQDGPSTQALYFVARIGEQDLRYKDIAIDHFLEAYNEYKIDWFYFTKDEDVASSNANKSWILFWRNEVQTSYTYLNYKYLYDQDYEFYKIGDFKQFIDNTVPAGGTSVEEGIDQRVIGGRKLVSKGDKYKGLYTLRRLVSNYTPKENWNKIAVSKSSSMASGSRLISFSDTSDVEIGNYIIESGLGKGTANGDAFAAPKYIPLGTRVTQILLNAGVVTSKKLTENGSSLPVNFLDHNGYITSGILVKTNTTAPFKYEFLGNGEGLSIGKTLIFPNSPSESTYIRLTSVKYKEQRSLDNSLITPAIIKIESQGVTQTVDLSQVSFFDTFTPGVFYKITPQSNFTVTAYCIGAGGGPSGSNVKGGIGGAAQGQINLQGGSTYTVIVGTGTNSYLPGYPGGGTGGEIGGFTKGGGGGGFTAIFSGDRTTGNWNANSTILLAAGGGGGGNDPSIGGNGGGTNGSAASASRGGGGGTQTAGGAGGGTGAAAGTAFQGASAQTVQGTFLVDPETGETQTFTYTAGGGGGGGYYGGGAGRGFATGIPVSGTSNDGGGGGGSGRIGSAILANTGSFSSVNSSGGGSTTGSIGNPGSFRIRLSAATQTAATGITVSVYDVTLDKEPVYFQSNNFTNQRAAVAFYHDRGCDITKPLQYFCLNSGCAQNNYDVVADRVKTKYIVTEIGAGDVPGNNSRWTEPSSTGSYDETGNNGNNPARSVLTFGAASVSWWSEAFPNQNFENHGEAQFNGGKRYASNCIFAKLTGTKLAASLQQEGHTNLTTDYVPIGFIEGMIRVDNSIWTGTTLPQTDQKRYFFIIRLANRWQSYTDFDTFADGGQRGKIVDFTKYPSSDFDLEYFGFAPNGSIMLPMASSNVNVSTGAILDSARTNYVNNVNSSTYYDRIHRITADITLTSTQRAYFQNPDSFSRFNEVTQTTEYVLPTGSYFKTLSTTGLLVWFNSFEDLQHTHSLYSYPFEPATQTPNQLPITRRTHNAINIYQTDGPVKITSNTWQTTQFRYLHYRRKQYEVLPMPTFIENRFPGIRVLNSNTQTTNVTTFLANTVNKLSVYTFSNDLDNRELCCPPLDTSPPFDTSPIGLSSTSSEPDISIGGLINIRTLSGNHPETKIYNIPSGQSLTSLKVDKKLKVNFGGTAYDLLIADTKPF